MLSHSISFLFIVPVHFGQYQLLIIFPDYIVASIDHCDKINAKTNEQPRAQSSALKELRSELLEFNVYPKKTLPYSPYEYQEILADFLMSYSRPSPFDRIEPY